MPAKIKQRSRLRTMTPNVLFSLMIIFVALAWSNEAGATNKQMADTESPAVAQSESAATPAASDIVETETNKDIESLKSLLPDLGAWEYLQPVGTLKLLVNWLPDDEKNAAFRSTGFAFNYVELGFKGSVPSFKLGVWDMKLSYRITGSFHSGGKLKYAWANFAGDYTWFNFNIRAGAFKVPFLRSVLQSSTKLYFVHRPQYTKPWYASYADDANVIGVSTEYGASLRLGTFNKFFQVEAGVFKKSVSDNDTWKTALFAVRPVIDTGDLLGKDIHLEVGGGFYYQEAMPGALENTRYAFTADFRLNAHGFFLGAEWVYQTLDDGSHKQEFTSAGLSDTITHGQGASIFTGYSFPKRKYEFSFRYEWYDPSDVEVFPALPEFGNQALSWFTLGVSWRPVKELMLMVNYTFKLELDADKTDAFSRDELLDVSNDELMVLLQINI